MKVSEAQKWILGFWRMLETLSRAVRVYAALTILGAVLVVWAMYGDRSRVASPTASSEPSDLTRDDSQQIPDAKLAKFKWPASPAAPSAPSLLATLAKPPTTLPAKSAPQKGDCAAYIDSVASATPASGLADAQQTPQIPMGERLAYVDETGDLWMRLRDEADAAWVRVERGVQDFQLLNTRIAMLKQDGSLWVGEGSLKSPPARMGESVTAFQLTQDRVGFLQRDGSLQVLEPSLDWRQEAAPRTVATHVRAFQMDGDRVAALGTDGSLTLRRSASAGFEPVAENVESFQIGSDWLAYVSANDRSLMLAQVDAQTELNPDSFVEVARNVSDFALEVAAYLSLEGRGRPEGPGEGAAPDPDAALPVRAEPVEARSPTTRIHIAVADPSGRLSYASGDDAAALTLHPVTGMSGVATVQWSNGRLAAQSRDGRLHIAQLQPDETGNEALTAFQDLGPVKDYRLNDAGALLLSRSAGAWSLLRGLDPAGACALAPSTARLAALDLSSAQLAFGRQPKL